MPAFWYDIDMNIQTAALMHMVIEFIEQHLCSPLSLSCIASFTGYSGCYIDRLFTQVMGQSLCRYIRRRQISSAAYLLVHTQKPVIDIAFLSGYKSQQSFTAAFASYYKTTPAVYRCRRKYYPLQLPLRFSACMADRDFSLTDIRPASLADISAWMDLVHLVIDGYPCFDEQEYRRHLITYISRGQALILMAENTAAGCIAFSLGAVPCIEFFAVHPLYRTMDIARLLLASLTDVYLCGYDLQVTTFRACDKADTGHRAGWQRLGFSASELLTEYGYPVQRFVLTCRHTGENRG